MLVGVIGISYKTADLALRERVVREVIPLIENKPVVLLSTCNRFEIYFSSRDLSQTHIEIINLLGATIAHKFYSYFGYNCFTHLCRVTSGMESAILGETEIQKQVKNAYQKAGNVPSPLHFLFQKALKVGKLLRSTLQERMPSLHATIWEIIQCLNKDPKKSPILFVGFSQINRQIFSHFHLKGCEHLTLSSRQPEGWEYTYDHGGKFLPWNQLHALQEYTIIITAAHAKDHVITSQTQFKKPILIFDLSVPRNVQPRVGLSPYVNLFNIERLDAIVEQKKERYRHEIIRLEKILQENVHRLMESYLEFHVAREAGERDDVADVFHACNELH